MLFKPGFLSDNFFGSRLARVLRQACFARLKKTPGKKIKNQSSQKTQGQFQENKIRV